MAYTNSTDLRAYLGTSTGSSGDDSLLTVLISAAQKAIDSYCGRTFETSSGVRYYRQTDLIEWPERSQYRVPGYTYPSYQKSWDSWGGLGNLTRTNQYVLWLGQDIKSVTTLTNGDGSTVISSTGYWLEPRNSTAAYQYIRLKTAESWTFDTDGEISVDGHWGYSTTAPDDIVQACKRWAAYLYRQRSAQVYDVTADPELGIITVPQGIPADVKLLLDPFKARKRTII